MPKPTRRSIVSGTMLRVLLASAWPMATSWPCAAAEPGFTLEALMARMAAAGDRRARFVETRRIGALEAPLESRGWLSIAGGRLVKVTEGTEGERLEVDGRRIVITTGNEAPRVIDMGMAPPLRVLIEAVRGPLSGDVASLRTGFETTLTGGFEGWALLLVPRVDAGLRTVRLSGHGAVVDRIDVVQGNGDEDVMVMSPFG